MDSQKKIFVQTSPGSFNHHAIDLLRDEDVLQNSAIQFAGPQRDIMQRAVEENGLIFAAVCNDIVKGNLIPSTVEALKDFKIEKLREGIRMKIEMCLLRRKEAVSQRLPLFSLVSHPAALKQIGNWLEKTEESAGRSLELTEEIGGTSEAARQLSAGELSNLTGVIAPEHSTSIYPGLSVVEKNIQDQDDNYTHFGLMEVSKRETPISEEDAREHLHQFVDRLRERIQVTSDFFQTAKVA